MQSLSHFFNRLQVSALVRIYSGQTQRSGVSQSVVQNAVTQKARIDFDATSYGSAFTFTLPPFTGGVAIIWTYDCLPDIAVMAHDVADEAVAYGFRYIDDTTKFLDDMNMIDIAKFTSSLETAAGPAPAIMVALPSVPGTLRVGIGFAQTPDSDGHAVELWTPRRTPFAWRESSLGTRITRGLYSYNSVKHADLVSTLIPTPLTAANEVSEISGCVYVGASLSFVAGLGIASVPGVGSTKRSLDPLLTSLETYNAVEATPMDSGIATYAAPAL